MFKVLRSDNHGVVLKHCHFNVNMFTLAKKIVP